MKFAVITLFPEMIQQTLKFGLIGQGLEKKLFEVTTVNPREFATDLHKTVDDRPFGGSDGMLLQAEVLQKSIFKARQENPEAYTVFLSPQGHPLTEKKTHELMQHKSLILVSARYAGVDQRLINSDIDEEISIGDYVLNGGELPALVLIEALSRQIPGVLGHADSAAKDSFTAGLLEAPAFTRPREWQGQEVPEVLLNGNHALILDWQNKMSWLVTKEKRPDLFVQAAKHQEVHFLKALKDFDQKISVKERQLCGLQNFSEVSWQEVFHE